MEPWGIFRQVVHFSYHFDGDSDPHLSEKLEPDPHLSDAGPQPWSFNAWAQRRTVTVQKLRVPYLYFQLTERAVMII
jgi:hypothetical protein